MQVQVAGKNPPLLNQGPAGTGACEPWWHWRFCIFLYEFACDLIFMQDHDHG